MTKSRAKRASREQGSILVLVMIAVLVIAVVVSSFVSGSLGQANASTTSLNGTSTWFAAHAGIWASAHELGAAEDGNVTGNAVTASYADDNRTTDADSDGFVDFSDDATFRAQPDGYFEARARDVGGGKFLLRARGKHQGLLKTLQAFVEEETTGFQPFARGAFGDLDFHLDSNVVTDSYNSDTAEYEDHAVTTTHAGKQIRNQNGHIGSNNDISLDSNSYIFGNANPGTAGNVTLASNTGVQGNQTRLTEQQVNPLPTWTVPSSTDGLLRLVAGTNYNDALSKTSGTTTLVAGKYVFSSFKLDSSAQVIALGGPDDVIEIYITGGDDDGDPSFWLDSNSRFDIQNATGDHDKTTGPKVIVYNVGKLKVSSNAEINVNQTGGPSDDYIGDPIQFQYYSDYVSTEGDSNTTAVDMNSNTNQSMVVYAPGGRTEFNSNMDFYGAIVSQKMEFNSNTFYHYDESLANLGITTAPDVYYVPQMLHEVR